MSTTGTTSTRFFAIPGCLGTIYWHQRFVDSPPELKWAGTDPRLLRNSPWFYLEDYPELMREITAARPVYTAPEENLPHVEFLETPEACRAHMQQHLDAWDFEKVFLRNARTHETQEISIDSSPDMLFAELPNECVIKLQDRCFLYRAVTKIPGKFVVIETARQ